MLGLQDVVEMCKVCKMSSTVRRLANGTYVQVLSIHPFAEETTTSKLRWSINNEIFAFAWLQMTHGLSVGDGANQTRNADEKKSKSEWTRLRNHFPEQDEGRFQIAGGGAG